MRHPKDAMLSYQHHCRFIKSHGFVSTQDVFIKYFVEGLLVHGSYGNMVKEALQFKSHPNLHIMHYEDMTADIGAELRRLDHFLGYKLTQEQLKNVQEQTSFSNMQKNDPLKILFMVKLCDAEVVAKEGGFIRTGQSGAWKDKLTQEQNALMDKYIAENFDDPELKARYQ